MDVMRLLALAAICAVAYVAGEALSRLHVPRLPAYLAVGAGAGQLIKSTAQSADLAFPVISPVALCVIGFVAGSHLVWRTIRPRIRSISYQVIGIVLAVAIVVGVVVFVVLPSYVPAPARLAAAILMGTVMLALSPPEAIAVVSEARAAGPFTQLVVGATVVMDVLVVSMFSLSLSVANKILSGQGSAAELAATVGTGTVLGVAGGLLVGLLLKAAVERIRSDNVVAVLVFGLAAVATVLAESSVRFAEGTLGLAVVIEPLLLAMIAGLFVANTASEPERFSEILERLAPWVYVVFFTLTGLGLHLEVLMTAAVPALFLWLLRVAGLWVGSTAAMALAKEPATTRRVAWRAFVPQAGIALALAATVAAEFPKGGPVVASVIIATVVLNEVSGPFLLRSALDAAGETAPKHEAAA